VDFILNIGLKSKTLGDIPVELAKQMLWAADLLIKTERVAQSDTEPTLVVEVTSLNGPRMTLAALHQLSVDLGQDCVGVYRPKTKGGALIGPKAAAWGEFNPEFFILPDGTRLSGPVAQAA
jgi:hypothetical protein